MLDSCPEHDPLGEDEWPRSARTCEHGSLWGAPCSDCLYGVAGPRSSPAMQSFVASLVAEAERRGAQAERERCAEQLQRFEETVVDEMNANYIRAHLQSIAAGWRARRAS